MAETPSRNLFELLNEWLDDLHQRARQKPLKVAVSLHDTPGSDDKIRKALRGADDEMLGLTWKKAKDEGWQHVRLIVEEELERRRRNSSTRT